jgi:methionyl-tRNA synthetase
MLENMYNLLSNPLILLLFISWSLFWKGQALWKAAKKGSKIWFIVLLIVNTMGLLEIAYLYFFSKRSKNIATQK